MTARIANAIIVDFLTLLLTIIFLLIGAALVRAEPALVTLDAGVVLGLQSVTLRHEATAKSSKPMFKFAASAVLQGRGRFDYQLLTGTSGETEFQPQGIFALGGVEFGQKQASRNQKPILFEASRVASHRFMASVPLAMVRQTPWFPVYQILPVEPIAVVDVVGFRFTATGEAQDKQISASETFQKAAVGLGARYQFVPLDGMVVDLTAAGSGEYKLICAEIVYRVTTWAGVKGSLEYSEVKIDPVIYRANRFGLAMEVAF